ncbi:hypothetical protein EVAR_31000_1 [Eumeta japonica]|uniref:Reverse transcriptase RNase H-like domain-containing protein n=1 Tax=Eumeta variegata TaxID=151549 RepID=A0A4C1VFD1_EUMVA|nr:hypothetical protein EVAR_31000_1 [Eumeta japonica]
MLSSANVGSVHHLNFQILDVSGEALGVSLMQGEKEKEMHPKAYASRKLINLKKKYSILTMLIELCDGSSMRFAF